MTNLERYDREFIKHFKVTQEELTGLKYRGIKKWDSVGHMDLMASLEEIFDIQLSTIDVLDFTDYNKGKTILAKYGVEI